MPPVGKAQYLWGVGAIRRGAAALGLACAIVISTFDYHTLATAWPIHAAVTWGWCCSPS